MLTYFEEQFEDQLEAPLTEMVRAGIRRLEASGQLKQPFASQVAILSAMIYYLASQNDMVGRGKVIGSGDLLAFLRTKKATVNKWTPWLLNVVPELATYQLSTWTGDVEPEASPNPVEETGLSAGAAPKAKKAKDLWFDLEAREALLSGYGRLKLAYLDGRWQEALSEAKGLLKASPSDGLGVRHMTVALAIVLDDLAVMEAVLSQFHEERYAQAMNRALFALCKGLDTGLELLERAFDHNPDGLNLLLGLDPIQERDFEAKAYEAGSFEEAEAYAFETGLIWRAVPNAWQGLKTLYKA